MMQTMMDSMFKEMRTEDRVDFMQNMMPRCMSMMFSELDPEARRTLAEAMLQRMMDELKSQRDAAAPTAAGSQYVTYRENLVSASRAIPGWDMGQK